MSSIDHGQAMQQETKSFVSCERSHGQDEVRFGERQRPKVLRIHAQVADVGEDTVDTIQTLT